MTVLKKYTLISHLDYLSKEPLGGCGCETMGRTVAGKTVWDAEPWELRIPSPSSL